MLLGARLDGSRTNYILYVLFRRSFNERFLCLDVCPTVYTSSLHRNLQEPTLLSSFCQLFLCILWFQLLALASC
jgi:hypothetical protein